MFDVATTFGGPVEVRWNLNLSESVITSRNLHIHVYNMQLDVHLSLCVCSVQYVQNLAYHMQIDVHLSSVAIRGRTVFHIQPEFH